MGLPSLTDWANTRKGLHQASQVLGVVNKALVEKKPNHLHLALQPYSEGLTSGTLLLFGEMRLDFTKQALVFIPETSEAVTIPLHEHSQVSLADSVSALVDEYELMIDLDRTHLTSEEPFELDGALASDYAAALHQMVTALKNLQRELIGAMTPVVVWPHGFDASFLWFATDETTEEAPHMNFGFSPGSEGFPRPYVYSYAHPIPEGMLDIKLPPPAYWYTESWTGLVIPYDDLLQEPDPSGTVMQILRVAYNSVFPLF